MVFMALEKSHCEFPKSRNRGLESMWRKEGAPAHASIFKFVRRKLFLQLPVPLNL